MERAWLPEPTEADKHFDRTEDTRIAVSAQINNAQPRALVLITRLSSLDSARLACKANDPMAG